MQVYNLHSIPPKDFLLYGLGTLEKLAENGDECARQTRNRLRIIVSSIHLSEELCNTSEFFFLSKCLDVIIIIIILPNVPWSSCKEQLCGHFITVTIGLITHDPS